MENTFLQAAQLEENSDSNSMFNVDELDQSIQSQLLVEELPDEQFDPELDATFKLIYVHFDDEFKKLAAIDSKIYTPVAFRTKIFEKYIEEFKNLHAAKLIGRSSLIQELFILHQTAKTLQRYNDLILEIPYQEFRAKFYFPNIIYLLIRFLPTARAFIQKTIRYVYALIKKRSSGIVNLHENSLYLDKDVIKSDVLYNFLGNALKKFNPFDVNNLKAFYIKIFLNIFYFYFKSEQKYKASWSSLWALDDVLSTLSQVPTREVIYRDVLTTLQIDEFRKSSPTMKQIHYNYSVFKNVILNNEFQSIYFTASEKSSRKNEIGDNQYKLLSFYDGLIKEEHQEESEQVLFLQELKKLPTIYRLLKSVHILSKKKSGIISNNTATLLKQAVLEELIYPFKNLISDSYIHEVLNNIARNFTDSILFGEYINIMTLTPIQIDQATFITQVRKFIQICLYGRAKGF